MRCRQDVSVGDEGTSALVDPAEVDEQPQAAHPRPGGVVIAAGYQVSSVHAGHQTEWLD
jgi:hypothetical protein